MTFGDAFAFTMLVLLSATSLWACLMGCLVLFPNRCAAAESGLIHRRRRCLWGGAVGSVGFIAVGLVMMNANPAAVKIIGIALMAGTVAIAILGAAGTVRIAARQFGPGISLRPEGRGAAVLILAGLLPGVGWFLFFPLQLFAGFGAGIGAIFARSAVPAQQQENA